MRRTIRQPKTDGWYRWRRVFWATGGVEPRVPWRVLSPTRDRRPSAGGGKACKAWSAHHHSTVFVPQELAHPNGSRMITWDRPKSQLPSKYNKFCKRSPHGPDKLLPLCKAQRKHSANAIMEGCRGRGKLWASGATVNLHG